MAAIGEGKYAQAFPSFGPERRGAPVVAFCRISDQPIKIRANVYEPDIVVVLDASLLKIVNVAAGLKPNGILVTTSKDSPEKVKEDLGIKNRLAVVDADKDCKGGSWPPHYQYHVAGIFGQGLRSGQERVLCSSLERAVWSNCGKEHLCIRAGLSKYRPYPINFI